jgi:histidine ammonia-lyase
VHALRRLALPSTVGLIETSGGQEDVQSFGWEAAECLRQAIRHGHAVASCELLTAYRALTLSPHPVPPGCRPLLDSLARVIGPIEADRPFGEDIERLTAEFWSGRGAASGGGAGSGRGAGSDRGADGGADEVGDAGG